MRKESRKWISLTTFFLCTALFTGIAAAAKPFDRLVIFGDSLTDPGNAFVITRQISHRPYELIPDAPYARGGLHFSNGETWVEQFAKRLRVGRSAGPAMQVRGVFTNYAVGGARARAGASFDLSSQALLALEDFGGALPADALYVVHIGGNDLRDALEALASDPAASAQIINAALTAIANNIVMLASSGATEFMVPNAPNLALVPAVRLQGPLAQAGAAFLSVQFNNALAATLANLEALLPIAIHRLDVFALIGEAVAMPAAAGFTEVELPCITPGTIVKAECDRPDDFLFWDGIHPTRAGHALLAERARAVVTAP